MRTVHRPGLWVLAFVVFTLAVILLDPLLWLDLAVRDAIDQHVPAWIVSTAGVTAKVGQGGPLSAIVGAVAAWFAYRSRTVWPLVAWGVTFAMLAVVGVVKVILRRGAPADPMVNAVEIFSKPFCGTPACRSYPSGHVVNAVVWYGLAVTLLGVAVSYAWANLLLWAPLVITFISVTVAGHHWVTDSVAAVLLAVPIHMVVRAVYLMRQGTQRRIPDSPS